MPRTAAGPPVVAGPTYEEEGTLNPDVFSKVVAVMRDMEKIGKEGHNSAQKYSFRSIDDMVAAIQPALIEHGLTIIPEVAQASSEDRTGADGRVLRFSTVIMRYNIISSVDGSAFTASMPGEAFDSADKAMNKAVSAATKYFLFYTFWPPVAREDADEYHYESSAPRSAAPRQPVSQTNNVEDAPTRQVRPAARPAAPAATDLRGKVRQAASRVENGDLLSDGQSRNLYRLHHHVLNWPKDRYLQEIEMVTGRSVESDRELLKSEATLLINQLKGHAGEEVDAPRDQAPPPPPEDDGYEDEGFGYSDEPF